ncbi:hypothetical protein IL54_4640 [Sphingobium sp. ba1]|jgi:plasmid stability protein|uniref:FitA-like ribbon-helix-helix domain-containing protein n=1 Tax=Sphingobium sp. ba1 TaxID=1522072 RepID=UPI000564B411|nr:hypothetical protein [Sphingobium sp. ba1]KGA95330.1 hypothetical protein IL54_4640 [Sphingobium sp. ba1]
MGQVLIRNLDEQVIAAYRELAVRNQRSLEAELRDALTRGRPMTGDRLNSMLTRLEDIRAMTPRNVRQTPPEELLREDHAD